MFQDIFFKNDKNFLAIGSYSKDNDTLKRERVIYSHEALKENGISEFDIDTVIHRNSRDLMKSLSGKSQVFNLSAGVKVPIFSVSIKDSKNADTVIVAILHSDKIKDIFLKKQDLPEPV